MSTRKRIIYNQAIAGAPVRKGELDLFPVARIVRIRIPGFPAELSWKRPEAIVVRRPNAAAQVIRIHDETRWAQAVAGLLSAAIVWKIGRWVRSRV